MRGPVRKEGPWCGGYSNHCDSRATTRILVVRRMPYLKHVGILRDWPLCEPCMVATAHMERGDGRMIFEVPVDWAGKADDLVATYEVMSS